MDYQKSKVYEWERTYVAQHGKEKVAFDNIQGVVDYLYESNGFRFPPKVKAFRKGVKRVLADATRSSLRFHKDIETETWVILHEVAHSMSSSFEFVSGRLVSVSDEHGPEFVGTYLYLINKHLCVPISSLTYTLKEMKIDYTFDTDIWNQVKTCNQ